MSHRDIFLFLFSFISLTAFGQDADSCQCKLMYGNVLRPTLVTFHHDSLVSYQNTILPNESVYKLIGKAPIDSVFKVKNYKWHTWSQTFQYNKEGIGNKIKGEFYIFHPFNLMDTGVKFNTYKLVYDNFYSDSVLYKDAYEIRSHHKLNSTNCNCFNSERYMYNGDWKKLDLSRKSLESINTTDSVVSENKNSFVWADACTFGAIRTCYLTGIGPVSIDMMDNQSDSDNYRVPVVFLDTRCKEFFRKQLNLDFRQGQ